MRVDLGIDLRSFYKGKKVLLTGHTGFKGAWMCEVLKLLGAEVVGFSMDVPTQPSLFQLLEMEKSIESHNGDIRNLDAVYQLFHSSKPEIVIHMAAQPLVRESYRNPVYTYETNVMGTVNVLESARLTDGVKSIVNVTTDKVYRNNEWNKGYVETDYLDGYDPYSNSKSCSELVTHSYIQSFLYGLKIAASTCRAGNVIGGGDFAEDRIIPDCLRAVMSHDEIVVRNPYSTRPYQHVLEPLIAYLLVAMEQYNDIEMSGCFNVGPKDDSCITTGELVTLFCGAWKRYVPDGRAEWIDRSDCGPHEANFLKLDCTKIEKQFNWKPKWSIDEAIDKVVEFESIRVTIDESSLSKKLHDCMEKQIVQYLNK